MTNEQNFFLNVISNYIHNRKTENVEDIDWGIVLRYAESHQVTAILYSQCKNALPKDFADSVKKSFLNSVCISVLRRQFTDAIVAELNKQKI